jgi:hypothetical protein
MKKKWNMEKKNIYAKVHFKISILKKQNNEIEIF